MVRVITAGHVNWDVTLRVDRLPAPDDEASIRSQRRSGGGSAANTAAALAGFDLPVGIVGSVGADEDGLLARRALEDAGVDCSHLHESHDRATTVKYLIVDDDGEVMVLGNDGANEAVTPANVDPDVVRGADHLHLTSQRPDTAAHLAELARSAGVTVSFDPGRRLADRDFSGALDHSDVVFVNDRESETVLSSEYPSSEFCDRVIVIKHGDDGALVHTPGGSYTHPGFGVDPVDTTGAGDAFAAGFIAMRLDGADYERALEFANACGAIAASREGARVAPTHDEVSSFLDEQFRPRP